MDIGFIGLGHMGQAMARTLLKAGFRLTVYNRTRARAEELQAEGAAVADSPAEASRGDLVITMLADDPAVEAVVFGEQGVIRALRRSAIHAGMSTITVALSKRLADAHRAAGQYYVAAPVFGRPDAAAAGKLFIVAAGEPEPIARCQPVFDAMGQRTFVVGPVQTAANLIKLCGNFLIASMIESLGEATTLIRKSGGDPQRFVEVMTNSLFPAPVYKTYGDLIVEQKFQPAGFSMPLGLKDIRSLLAAAETHAVPMPVGSLVRDHFISAIARGGANLDWSGLARVAAQDAGL
jgi:3-hydroxyisobutyrate dehydrogenase-like beta-hydroxyacid dehydrogenase